MQLSKLQPEQLVKPRRFELRMSLVFASLFISMGIHIPYFPLWLEHQGFRPEEIAVVLSAPLFLRVLTVPIITALADRAGDRADVYIAAVAGALVLSAGYFLPPGYVTVLIVSLALQAVWTAHPPLADGLALSGVRRFGVRYASMRIWGSISYLMANFLAGVILSYTGAGAIPALISGALAVALAFSLLAPRLGRPRRATAPSATDLQRAAPLLTPYFLAFVMAAGAINSSHGYLFAFGSIYWKSLGIGDGVIGLLWAVAVLAEVGVFMIYTRVFGKTRAPGLLALAAIAGVMRWMAVPLVWPAGLGEGGFFATQVLHALSTGLVILGVQQMIAETVSEERTGAAQGVAFFAHGVAMASVTLASGPLYEAFAGDGFYAMAGVAFAGLLLAGLAWRTQPQSVGPGGSSRDPE
ncbi:MAG: MFS transporter [Rhizobiaceae bacterium]